jgi:hypothetical protein
MAMRPFGVNANPGNLVIQQMAAQGVTPETVTAACEEAKRTKPDEAFTPDYVVGIVKRWAREAKRLNVAGASKPGAVPAPAPALVAGRDYE